MGIHPGAELKCNSQSARRRKAWTTRQWIRPFVLERSDRDASTFRRKLDGQARRRARGHLSLRALLQIESRRTCFGLAIECEACAGEARIENLHAVERYSHPLVDRPSWRAPCARLRR